VKTLLIARHAKSDWAQPGLADHDRPLNDRGRRDAPAMGRRLAERGAVPDRIRSSTALRARMTAAAFAEAFGGEASAVELDEIMYATSVERLLDVTESLDDDADSVMLVGHNPEFSALVGRLTGDDVELSTCTVAEVRLPIDRWADASGAAGELVRVDRPKDPLVE
jgi:phosphohistidine phosphatase